MKHTALPWLIAEGVEEGSVVIMSAEVDDAIIASMGQDMPESAVDNARFVIKCVQAHDQLIAALSFCGELADEELEHVRVGTGAEVALRHIKRKASETLAKLG